MLLGGRGSGKTFAGAWWIDNIAQAAGRRIALVGPTLHDVREVMVEGPSGLKALHQGEERPRWEAGRKRLVWKNGSEAHAFSAEDPDSLRGPQFHDAWAEPSTAVYSAARGGSQDLVMERSQTQLTSPSPTMSVRT